MPKENNKRIAKNTLILYFRMLFTMGVSLYTSRIVLNTLGVEDFGVYNVVGGVVAMFGLISTSLSAASQRFITFELGEKKERKLQEVFSTTVTVHLLLAFIILILSETAGLWFLNTQMNITRLRMNAANWVYQCSVISFLISIMSVPYNAAIIAYEKMKAFAYIGTGEVLLKLIAILALPLLPYDKLKVYAIFIMIIAGIVRFLYTYYCKRNFTECVFKFSWNRALFNRIISFAGWNFIGASSYILTVEGVNILLNIFCGLAVNAAQGIANQVQNAISGFITNFMTALNPQITKSFASNDRDYMMRLVFQGARFSFYLMFFLSLPVLFETQSILRFWLKMVPDYAVIFVQLSLILAISQTLSNPLITAMLATGNIRNYQIIVGGLQMLNLPLSYIALRIGFPPQGTLVIAITLSLICLGARLYLLRGMIKLPMIDYLRNVLLNVVIVGVLASILPFIICLNIQHGLPRFFSVCFSCAISTASTIYFIGFSKYERTLISVRVLSFWKKYVPL